MAAKAGACKSGAVWAWGVCGARGAEQLYSCVYRLCDAGITGAFFFGVCFEKSSERAKEKKETSSIPVVYR